MSNGFAIAAVTRVLQDLLHSGLTAAGISGAVGGTIAVTALPPDRILGENSTETTQLNLYLHQVTHNAAWSPRDLPTRNDRFERNTDPQLALNLHYLLTAYAEAEFQGEILLGYAMQLLHANAILSRDFVRNILGNPPGGGMGPVALQALVNSDLADQVELIKIRPQPLSMDDMSKLWTAFQTHYRTTAAYDVSVVLIDRPRPKHTPLPVLSRGQPDASTGRDEGVTVRPSLVPAVPTLTALHPTRQQPAARLGEEIVFDGHHLAGDAVTLRFTAERSGHTLTLPATSAGDSRITVALPPPPPLPPAPPPPPLPPGSPLDPASWQAGLYRTSAVITNAARDRTTNALPLVLAPLVRQITPAAVPGGITFTVIVSPPVRAGQRVSLIVGTTELMAQPIASPPATTVTFSGTGFTSGAVLPVRLRVDGIDSILIDRTAHPPVFDPTQQVTIP
jgi:hypothetical protein